MLQQRARLGMFGLSRANACGDGADLFPLSQRRTIAHQLQQLRRLRNRVGKRGHDRRNFRRQHGATKVEQAVESEGLTDRVSRLDGKAVGERFAAETNAVFPLQKWTIRPADGFVFYAVQGDARILQGLQQALRAQREPAVAHSHEVVVPEPFGAQVITRHEFGRPRIRVDHEAVPLDEQRVRRRHVLVQTLQHELRIRFARAQRLNRNAFDALRHLDIRRHGIGEEERASEFDARL